MKTRTLVATATSIAILMTATAAGARATTTSTQGAGFTIPDVTTRMSVITITDPAVLTNVTFSLNGLTHTYLRDLSASLMHNGTSVSWLNRDGGGNDLDGNYLISDTGTTTLGGAFISPRPSGTYSPISSLSAFNGVSGAGDWILSIRDDQTGDTGNLNSWTLNLTSGTPVVVPVSAVPEPASWAMMIGGIGMAGGSLRRRKKVTTKVAFAAS